jgi:hypothetical protein
VSAGPWRTLPDAAKVDFCQAELGAVLDRSDDVPDIFDGPPGGVAPPAKE